MANLSADTTQFMELLSDVVSASACTVGVDATLSNNIWESDSAKVTLPKRTISLLRSISLISAVNLRMSKRVSIAADESWYSTRILRKSRFFIRSEEHTSELQSRE